MKVLNIGCTSEYMCNDPRITFGHKDIELMTLDVDPASNPDILHDIREPLQTNKRFDVVYMSHVLEHIERHKLRTVIENCKTLLNPAGQLWVYVPCLEWACEEVLKGNETIVIQGSLYGGQKDEWDTHKAAYTLKALVALLSTFEFAVRKATRSEYLSIVNGKKYTCYQNVVVGVAP
jgi:predicted SAM-dependent methyltransferase